MDSFEWNHFPEGEGGMHYAVLDCPCRPTKQIRQGHGVLVHRSMIDAIPWIAAEIDMGIRCLEHRIPIDQRQLTVGGHIHRRQLEPLYEYPHSIQ